MTDEENVGDGAECIQSGMDAEIEFGADVEVSLPLYVLAV